LQLEVAEPFVGAKVVGSLCPACTDQRFLGEGGAVLMLRRELQGARFDLGKITITAKAVAALAEASQHAVEFLVRHVRGDWGEGGYCDEIQLTLDEERRGWEATDDSAKINKSNLLHGRDRIMSEYTTNSGQRLWIITTLDGPGGTTIFLPEEY
jgi:hypothetical protein